MSDNIITVEHNPSPAKMDVLYVEEWPIWTKEESTFPWTYEKKEMCYILSGEATVTPEGGDPVTIKRKDLVTFPKGMNCTWEITKPIRKHYYLSD
ncbi:MAG: cupin domain-containing protein [Gammaproteobacteria bacterium]